MRSYRSTALLVLLALLAACSTKQPPAQISRPKTAITVLSVSEPAVETTTTTTAPEPEPDTTPAEPPPIYRTSRTTALPEPPTREDKSESGSCGGTLPPCYVLQRESGGNPTAYNAAGCGGRGCYTQWQFDPRTWKAVADANPELDLPQRPDSATAEQADAAARALWDDGNGCSNWDAC